MEGLFDVNTPRIKELRRALSSNPKRVQHDEPMRTHRWPHVLKASEKRQIWFNRNNTKVTVMGQSKKWCVLHHFVVGFVRLSLRNFGCPSAWTSHPSKVPQHRRAPHLDVVWFLTDPRFRSLRCTVSIMKNHWYKRSQCWDIVKYHTNTKYVWIFWWNSTSTFI